MLTCEDGSKHFVKAASTKAQRMFAEAYREEARKLEALPAGGTGRPAPVVAGRRRLVRPGARARRVATAAPARGGRRTWTPRWTPWSVVADLLTPPPAGLELDDVATEFASFPGYWDHLRTHGPP